MQATAGMIGLSQRPFFALFSARFSMRVLAGFFLVAFFCCIPFAITSLL